MATRAQIKASTEYNRRQDSIMVRAPKPVGAAIRAAADAAGLPLQQYILQAVKDRMIKDGRPLEIEQQQPTE